MTTDVLIMSDPRGQYTLVNATTREPIASPFYSLPDVARVAQSIANLGNVRVWSQELDHQGAPIGDARLFAPVASRDKRVSS
jgi:hypothetical protein